MNEASDHDDNSTPEPFPPARADRLPTPDEEISAEQAAKDVDVAKIDVLLLGERVRALP